MAIFAQFQGTQRAGFISCARGGVRSNLPISVTAENGGLKVNTPYSSAFVNDLKTEIPATARRWNQASKAWLVSKDYADALKQIIDRTYGCDVVMPTIIAADIETFEITFQADYIAACKNEAASVHSNGGWNAKIPEKVLREWFGQTDTSMPATLYGVLGIKEQASDLEVKKAYKRAARQWHPDLCREANAREMFEAVKDAYDVLGDVSSRNKYNAGLMFQKIASQGHRGRSGIVTRYSTFVSPLRCGILTVVAKKDLGIVVVEKILKWDDIVNDIGPDRRQLLVR